MNRGNFKTPIVFLLILFSTFSTLEAQQVPLYSQYMLNGFLLNPAIAGSEGYTSVNLTAREQWIGFKDAPGTYALSFQSRVLMNSYISKNASVKRRQHLSSRSGKVGFGGYIFNDRNGAVERIGIRLSYAYHIRFQRSQLSLGLSAVAYQFSLDEDKIRLDDPDDMLYIGAAKSVLIPDADAGVYYSGPNFYAGFSVDQLFESVLKLGDSGYDNYKMERNYYLMGGYDYFISNELILTPSILAKMAEDGAWQIDFNAKLYYDQSYWAGLTYRTGNAIIIMAGLSIDKFVFGYAFDISLGSIMKHSFGTHEFMFAAKFGDNARRYRWLNRF